MPDLHTLGLPFWFLVLSLFLPRISLLVLYLQGHTGHTFVVSLVPALIALLVPRILILFWIYSVQGFSIWFLVHAVALLIAWGSFSGGTYRRRYYRREI
jgi:asparagine N-glycosylation enzyme membrane subunit Stt3